MSDIIHKYVVTWDKQHSEGYDEEAVALYDFDEARAWVKDLKEEKGVVRIKLYSLTLEEEI